MPLLPLAHPARVLRGAERLTLARHAPLVSGVLLDERPQAIRVGASIMPSSRLSRKTLNVGMADTWQAVAVS